MRGSEAGRMVRRVRWSTRMTLAVATVMVAVGAVGPARGADAQPDQTPSAAQRLAEHYAPILMVKAQQHDCDTDGEAFAPMSVEAVLDNPQVLLRQLGDGDPVVLQGPSAADLHDLGEGFFLDFPGSALDPGCIYERDFQRYTRDLAPTVYAHIIEDAGDGQLVLQYWFYWYFNDWNNKHESDWEGIALLFPAPTVVEALDVSPERIGYSQHEGGVGVGWDDGDLRREGDRPIVYSSAGSHASYLGSAVHLGRSAHEGFGCDTTEGPSRRIDPEVVVLPTRVDDPTDPLAWVEFRGRWGERHDGPFNGPTGPPAKGRWTDPMPWFDDLRSESVTVPGVSSLGSGVVGRFCGVVESGSDLLIAYTSSPIQLLATVAALAAGVGVVARRTVWSRIEPLPVRRSRRYGQVLRAASTLYRRHLRTFAPIGGIYLPAVLVAGLLVELLDRIALIGPLLELSGDRSGTGVVVALFVGGLPNLVAAVAVHAAVADALGRLDRGEPPAVGASYRAVGRRLGDLAGGLARAVAVLGLAAVTVIGIPWAVRRLVQYQFFSQVVVLEDRDGPDALDRSARLVDGRWWHTAFVVALINGAVFVVGLVGGLMALLLATPLPLWSFMALMALAAAALLPVGAIATTLLYGDAFVADADEATTVGLPA